MAKGAKIASNMLDFAAGVNHGLRPTASKAGMKALNKTSQQAAKQVLESTTGKAGQKFATGALNNTMTTGIASTIKNLDASKGVTFKQAFKSAHSIADSTVEGGTRMSKRKLAGTAASAGIAGRVASGGGLYRDRYGNVNVPGLPFI